MVVVEFTHFLTSLNRKYCSNILLKILVLNTNRILYGLTIIGNKLQLRSETL